MLLLIARHGNTFEAGDKAVWVGARTDLPLTAKGKAQAEAIAAGLTPVSPRIERIVAGPLRRTRQTADIAAAGLGFDSGVEVDERLREIDYGLWERKSSGEIAELGGESELKAWNERGVWPASPGWSPPEQTIADNISRLAGELAQSVGENDAALLVTSNGVIKFFLKLIPGAFEDMAGRGELKAATGNVCALTFEGGAWRVAFWNRQPPQIF
jgi:broad specificity phosphatase PhoE